MRLKNDFVPCRRLPFLTRVFIAGCQNLRLFTRGLTMGQARNPPLRLPRYQSSVLRRAQRSIARQGFTLAQTCDVPPGERLLSCGHSRWSQRGHDNGIHSAGGPDDGHALRHRRSGILTYLMRQGNFTGQQIDELLNKKSGLLGISGSSGDMREIVASMNEGNARAQLAFDIFVHRLRSAIGSMIAVLAGIDALIFSAGIGENSPEVRAAAGANFAYLNLKLDSEKNRQSHADRDIASADSAVRVFVIRAQEDWAIAKACWKLTAGRPATLRSPAEIPITTSPSRISLSHCGTGSNIYSNVRWGYFKRGNRDQVRGKAEMKSI